MKNPSAKQVCKACINRDAEKSRQEWLYDDYLWHVRKIVLCPYDEVWGSSFLSFPPDKCDYKTELALFDKGLPEWSKRNVLRLRRRERLVAVTIVLVVFVVALLAVGIKKTVDTKIRNAKTLAAGVELASGQRLHIFSDGESMQSWLSKHPNYKIESITKDGDTRLTVVMKEIRQE